MGSGWDVLAELLKPGGATLRICLLSSKRMRKAAPPAIPARVTTEAIITRKHAAAGGSDGYSTSRPATASSVASSTADTSGAGSAMASVANVSPV